MTPQGIKQGPWIRQQAADPLDNERLQPGQFVLGKNVVARL